MREYEWKHKIELDLIFLNKHMPTGIYKYKEKRDELHDAYRKAHAFDKIVKAREKVGSEIGLSDYYEIEDFGRTVIDIVDRSD